MRLINLYFVLVPLRIADSTSTNAVSFSSARTMKRSHGAVIRVYDDAGNVIQTHEHKGDFKER